MLELVPEVRALLAKAGFQTRTGRPDSPMVLFEDVSIMGQIIECRTASDIVLRWETLQDNFLRDNALRFRQDVMKAWNLYTILLTQEPASPEISPKLLAIEEDFRATRKIARAGILSSTQLLEALAPILPLRNLLTVGEADARARLIDRLSALGEAARGLSTDTAPAAIAAAMLGKG